MKCPACGSPVSKLGTNCPHCGTFVPDPFAINFNDVFDSNRFHLQKELIALIIFLIIVLYLLLK